MLQELEQFNALIVGATRGIGLGFVRSLLNDDRVQRLFCTYRSTDTAGELFELRDKLPDRVVCVPMDVTDESQISDAIQKIGDTVEEIHLALYCVGILHEGEISPEKSLRDLKAEHLLYSFQVNSIGAVLLAKHAAKLFNRHKPGLFAAISAKVGSIGDNGLGGWYGYRASKAALNMFLKTASIEYGWRCPNTIVVALHPGTTDTGLSKPFQDNVPEEQLFSVEKTVSLLSGVMSNLTIDDSGEFYSWNGNRLPW